MANYSKLLMKKFFEENGFVKSTIDSFNYFIAKELQKILDENREIEPTIIPPNVESFKIKLDKIWIEKPEITEADGSKRPIFPSEARLRKLSYSAPIFIEVSAHINGVQRESFTTQIGNIPVMLKSKYCHLYKKNKEELIEKGEDPDDPGGYFVINGTEKVLIDIDKTLSVSLNQDSKAIALAKQLRRKGKNVSIYYGKPSKALAYANSYGIKKVILVGAREVKVRKFKIKDMKTGKERLLKFS